MQTLADRDRLATVTVRLRPDDIDGLTDLAHRNETRSACIRRVLQGALRAAR